MIDVQRLLDEEEHGWQALWRCFERIPDDRFEQPIPTEDRWSPKDVMYHVAGWLADCERQLESLRSGSFEAADESAATVERRNQEWLELSCTMSPAEVRAELAASRRGMIAAFDTLDRITPQVAERFEESGVLHYATHAEALRSCLEEAGT